MTSLAGTGARVTIVGPRVCESGVMNADRDPSATVDVEIEPAVGAVDFAGMYHREFRRVARTVYLIVQDRTTAEDITQDAFLALSEHWSKVSRYQRPDAWVRRVAIRRATRHLRRERARGPLERRLAGPEVSLDVDTFEVWQAVAQLPVRQRTAVVLYYYEDPRCLRSPT